MADGTKEMTFWEHLDELRKVLFRSAVLLAVLMAGLFSAKSFIFDRVVFAPADSSFILYRLIDKVLLLLGMEPLEKFSIKIINIDLPAQFFIHMSTTFYIALVIAVPFIVYQLWTFVAPALYPNEKRAAKKAFGFAAVLFYSGLLLGYLLIFPLTLRFLGTYQVSVSVTNDISLRSYISMFVWLILIMGLVFELPCVAALLSKFGVINRKLLKKYRRHAFTILLIVAAFITPSGDPFTLFAVGLPLYALYEISIMMCGNRPTRFDGGSYASDGPSDSPDSGSAESGNTESANEEQSCAPDDGSNSDFSI